MSLNKFWGVQVMCISDYLKLQPLVVIKTLKFKNKLYMFFVKTIIEFLSKMHVFWLKSNLTLDNGNLAILPYSINMLISE